MNLPRGSKRGAVGAFVVLLVGATFAFGYGDDGGGEREGAERAALEETGGGEAISVESDDGGYEVDVLDGDEEISVGLDSRYRVVEVETELLRR